MPEYPDEIKRAMRYWPQIEQAASARMTTADLWDTIKAAAESEGYSSPGVSVAEINRVRSMATEIQANSRRLERMDPSYALEGRIVSTAPWSRDLAARDALPMYQVRYQHTIEGPNGLETSWRTSVMRGQLPSTLGDLLDAVTEDAEHKSKGYGAEHVGIDSIQLLAI